MTISIPGVEQEGTLMSRYEIRPANRNDLATIVEFNCRLAQETENKVLDRPTVEAGVRALLENPQYGRYFVACLDTRIIGQVMHAYEWSDWRNGMIWWLQSVYVDEEHRGRGVFRLLFQHILGEALDSGSVPALRLYVERENTRAQQAYRAMGLTEPGYFVMERMFP